MSLYYLQSLQAVKLQIRRSSPLMAVAGSTKDCGLGQQTKAATQMPNVPSCSILIAVRQSRIIISPKGRESHIHRLMTIRSQPLRLSGTLQRYQEQHCPIRSGRVSAQIFHLSLKLIMPCQKCTKRNIPTELGTTTQVACRDIVCHQDEREERKRKPVLPGMLEDLLLASRCMPGTQDPGRQVPW